jgi:hypothetical protein
MKLSQLPNPFSGVSVPSSGGNIVDVNKTTIGEIISKILPYLFSIIGILLLVYLVCGGLEIMLSKGDPKTMEGAKQKITNALIGFFIVFLSFVFVRLIGQVFGVVVFETLFK